MLNFERVTCYFNFSFETMSSMFKIMYIHNASNKDSKVTQKGSQDISNQLAYKGKVVTKQTRKVLNSSTKSQVIQKHNYEFIPILPAWLFKLSPFHLLTIKKNTLKYTFWLLKFGVVFILAHYVSKF